MGFNFKKILGPAAAAVTLAATGSPQAAMTAYSVGNTVGGAGGKKAQPQRSMQGTSARTAEQQLTEQEFSKLIHQIQTNPFPQQLMQNVGKPQSIFDPQELYNKQQLTDKPSRLAGVIEPLNEGHRNALGQQLYPDYTNQGLAQYLQPFESRSASVRNDVMNSIGKNALFGLGDIKAGLRGTGNLGYSADYGGRVPQLGEAYARALAQAENQFNREDLASAFNLRNQSIGDMLNASNFIQKQNQTELSASNPLSQMQNDPRYAQLQALAPFIQGYPVSQTQTGPMAAQPGMMERFGNAAGFLGQQMGQGQGNFFGNMLGNKSPNRPWTDPDAPKPWVDPDASSGIWSGITNKLGSIFG